MASLLGFRRYGPRVESSRVAAATGTSAYPDQDARRSCTSEPSERLDPAGTYVPVRRPKAAAGRERPPGWRVEPTCALAAISAGQRRHAGLAFSRIRVWGQRTYGCGSLFESGRVAAVRRPCRTPAGPCRLAVRRGLR